MEKSCDHQSVGVVLKNDRGELALLKRAKFPFGMALPAGHIDTHGNPERAAIDEVREEIGVDLAVNGLIRTSIDDRRVKNPCRRPNGDYHIWNVYEATVGDVELQPDPDETHGADWYDLSAVQALANRAMSYRHGKIDEKEWEQNPGLEPIWADFLGELGYIE